MCNIENKEKYKFKTYKGTVARTTEEKKNKQRQQQQRSDNHTTTHNTHSNLQSNSIDAI